MAYFILITVHSVIVSIIMSWLASNITDLQEHKKKLDKGICPKCNHIWIKKDVHKGNTIYQCKNGHIY